MDAALSATFVCRHDLGDPHADRGPIPFPGLDRFPFRLFPTNAEIDEPPALPERDVGLLFQYTCPNRGPSSAPVQKVLSHLLLAYRTSFPGCTSRYLHMHNTSRRTVLQSFAPLQSGGWDRAATQKASPNKTMPPLNYLDPLSARDDETKNVLSGFRRLRRRHYAAGHEL